MNNIEIAKLFAKVQLVDNRQAGQLVLAEWFDILGHLDFADCVAAVTLHRRESTEYLQPAHIIANVKRIRQERALTAPALDERVGSGDPKPKNLAALEAAWNNPAEFERQWAIYEQQLRDEGYAA